LVNAAEQQLMRAKQAIENAQVKQATRILQEYITNPHAQQKSDAEKLLMQAVYADSDEAAMKMLLTASDEQFARMQSDTPLPHPEIQNPAVLKHWNKTVRENYNLVASKRREIAKKRREIARRRQQREQEEAAWDLDRIKLAKKIISQLSDWKSEKSQSVIQRSKSYYQVYWTGELPETLRDRDGKETIFSGAIRPGFSYAGGNLSNLGFRNGDLRCVSFKACNLEKCDFTMARLQWANLSSVNLKGALLNSADLSNANLKNANLTNAYLGNTDFSGANLENANLSGCTIYGTDFRLAKNLNSVTWKGATYINQDVPLFPEGITPELLGIRGRDRRGDPNFVVCGRCKQKQFFSQWSLTGKCPDCGFARYDD